MEVKDGDKYTIVDGKIKFDEETNTKIRAFSQSSLISMCSGMGPEEDVYAMRMWNMVINNNE